MDVSGNIPTSWLMLTVQLCCDPEGTRYKPTQHIGGAAQPNKKVQYREVLSCLSQCWLQAYLSALDVVKDSVLDGVTRCILGLGEREERSLHCVAHLLLALQDRPQNLDSQL